MNCAAAESLLDLYAEGRLSAGWKRSIDSHLKGCSKCADQIGALTALRRPPEAPRAPSHLLRELEKLGRTPLKKPLRIIEPATRVFRPDFSVFAAAAAYAAFLLLLAASRPGPVSQQFTAPPWGEYR